MRQWMRAIGLAVRIAVVAALAGSAPTAGLAQVSGTLGKIEKGASDVGQAAGKAISQPAQDVGVSKTEIPPLLTQAQADPYGLGGVGTCPALATEITRLNGVLGPDLDAGQAKGEDKSKALADAGGQAVVSAIVPFRGVVREVSGAASAQRAYNAAVDAGYARRGFLRGVHKARSCKSVF